MDIIHEILTEPEEEVEEESPVSDEQEILEDEWIKPQTQLQEYHPPQAPVVETTTPVIQRPTPRYPSTHSTPRGARRVRGGAASAALLERLKVGMYFAVWFALNLVYNSKFSENVLSVV
jgi:hypothetical protein